MNELLLCLNRRTSQGKSRRRWQKWPECEWSYRSRSATCRLRERHRAALKRRSPLWRERWRVHMHYESLCFWVWSYKTITSGINHATHFTSRGLNARLVFVPFMCVCYVSWCLLQADGSLCLCFGSVLSTAHREALLDKESEISSLLERLRIREGEIQRIREDEAQRASFLQNAILTYVQGSPLAHFSPKKWTLIPRLLWFSHSSVIHFPSGCFATMHNTSTAYCKFLQCFYIFEWHVFMNLNIYIY